MALTPPLITESTSTASAGRYDNMGSQQDILQVFNPDGSVAMHINYDGTIDPPFTAVNSVTIVTPAQLHALSTTPIRLLPAAGSGTIVVPTSFMFLFHYDAPAYTVTGVDGSLYIGWGNTNAAIQANPALVTNWSGLIDATASTFMTAPSGGISATLLSKMDNLPLYFGVKDTFSAGGGHLHILTSYTLLTDNG